MRCSSARSRTLSRPHEADHPSNEGVVAAVRASGIAFGEQVIQLVRGLFGSCFGHLDATRPQARCRHRNKHRIAGPPTRSEIDEALLHEIRTRQALCVRPSKHGSMVGLDVDDGRHPRAMRAYGQFLRSPHVAVPLAATTLTRLPFAIDGAGIAVALRRTLRPAFSG